MTKSTDDLNQKTQRPGRTRRSRVIAGATLTAAVAATALGMGLTSGGAASAAPASPGTERVATAAYVITKSSDGSVLVKVNQTQSIVAADAKLSSMGIHEKIAVFPKAGPATTPGPVTCTPTDGAPQQPQIKVLLGKNGTEVIPSGNTGAGTWHLGSCDVFPANYQGNSGAAG